MNHKRITDEEREAVIKLSQAGKSPTEIAKFLHISKSSISGIKREAHLPNFYEARKARKQQIAIQNYHPEPIDSSDEIACAIAHIQYGLDILNTYHNKSNQKDDFIHTIWEAFDKLTQAQG